MKKISAADLQNMKAALNSKATPDNVKDTIRKTLKAQGYDDKLDESLAKDGKESTKKQSLKDRRDESKGEEKAKGKRAYSSDPDMDIKQKFKVGDSVLTPATKGVIAKITKVDQKNKKHQPVYNLNWIPKGSKDELGIMVGQTAVKLAPASSKDDYDCEELIKKEIERLEKRKAAAEKRKKKSEPKKNKERISKVSGTITKSLIERIDDKEDMNMSITELKKIIKSYEDAIKDLKKLLAKVKQAIIDNDDLPFKKGGKIITKGGIDYDCDKIIADAKARLNKGKKAAKKADAKPESKKNIERVEKVTDVIEESVVDRIKGGKEVSTKEIEDLINLYEKAIIGFKKLLKAKENQDKPSSKGKKYYMALDALGKEHGVFEAKNLEDADEYIIDNYSIDDRDVKEITKEEHDSWDSLQNPKTKGKKFKLGDMWSEDFDYEGMVEMGLKTDKSWSDSDLRNLFDSMEDVNYHTEGGHLWEYIQNKDPKHLKEFHESLKTLTKTDWFKKGGSIKNQYHYKNFNFGNHPAKAPAIWDAWSEQQREHFLWDHKAIIEAILSTDLTIEPGTRISGFLNVYEDKKKSYSKLNKYIRKAIIDHVKEGSYKKGGSIDHDWIQGVVDSPKFRTGAFTRKAKAAGLSTTQLMNEVLDHPGEYSERTKRQAQFMKNVTGKMAKGGKTQGYNARLDESLSKDGTERTKKQSLKDRRDESKGEEKHLDHHAYSSDPYMFEHGGKTWQQLQKEKPEGTIEFYPYHEDLLTQEMKEQLAREAEWQKYQTPYERDYETQYHEVDEDGIAFGKGGEVLKAENNLRKAKKSKISSEIDKASRELDEAYKKEGFDKGGSTGKDKRKYNKEGIRLTNCCGAMSTYFDEDLICKKCYKNVGVGQGDGTEKKGDNFDYFKKGGSTDKDWIQGVVDSPNFRKGAFTKKADERGISTTEFMNDVLDNPSYYDSRTRHQAQFMKNVSGKYEKGGYLKPLDWSDYAEKSYVEIYGQGGSTDSEYDVDDVLKVAKSLSLKPNKQQIQYVLDNMDSQAEADPDGHWTTNMEDLLYEQDIKKSYAKGGRSQGYNARLDESLSKDGSERTEKQTLKDRRDESKAEEKHLGHRAYSSDPDMLEHGGKIAEVIELLPLKKKRPTTLNNFPHYETSWGTKTAEGIFHSISRIIEENPTDEEKGGREIAEMLGLKKKRPTTLNKFPHYETSWGTKTDIGLYNSLDRIINE